MPGGVRGEILFFLRRAAASFCHQCRQGTFAIFIERRKDFLERKWREISRGAGNEICSSEYILRLLHSIFARSLSQKIVGVGFPDLDTSHIVVVCTGTMRIFKGLLEALESGF